IARRIEAFRSSSSALSVTVPPDAWSLALGRLQDWHSIVSSANSMIGSCAQDPERHLRGEQAATRGEHGATVGVGEEVQRFELAHVGRALDPGTPTCAEGESEELAGARVGVRRLTTGLG